MNAENKQADHLDLLSNIGEWMALLAGSTDVGAFLNRTVELVAKHLEAGVCSIYLFDEATDELVLRATVGLRKEAIGNVRMRMGEGLVGTAMQERRTISVAKASAQPEFKFFPEAGEEPYDAFLAVPIQRGVEQIGVLVAQRSTGRDFSAADAAAVRALASQLAGAIESARVMLDMQTRLSPEAATEISFPPFLKGEAASPGQALGPSLVFRQGPSLSSLLNSATYNVGTQSDLDRAVAATSEQIESLQRQLEHRLPEAAALIFEAHVMMLKDNTFVGRMQKEIRDGESAGRAVLKTAQTFIDFFEGSSHDYMREKAHDVEDIARRLLSNLVAGQDNDPAVGFTGRIVIAHDLLVSDMLKVAVEDVGAVVLGGGGTTSHVSILARSLGVPMVIVHAPSLTSLPDGTPLLVDAGDGNIHISPSPDVLERYKHKEQARLTAREQADAMQPETFTRDHVRVKLLANINLLGELDLALSLKAEGVGLYRTEFPFLVRDTFPTEDEQYRVYSILLDRMDGRPVTLRTLDVGGDKVLAYFDDAGEPNPVLGLRSTRFALAHTDIMDTQLRAILRAAEKRPDVRLMFPMIGSLDEFRRAKERVVTCHRALKAEGHSVGPLLPVGMMVELPAVVEIMDELCEEADFFSVGTNDFVQYMLGIDRTNERVASYYCPHHPAVLRALVRIADACARHDRTISVCGEMAHDPRYIPFFLGIGIRHLSIDAGSFPAVQAAVANWSQDDAREYAQRLLSKKTISEIESELV